MATWPVGPGQTYTTINAAIQAADGDANPIIEIREAVAYDETLDFGVSWTGTMLVTVIPAARHDGTAGTGARVRNLNTMTFTGSGSNLSDASALVIEWLEFDGSLDVSAQYIFLPIDCTVRNFICHSRNQSGGTQPNAAITFSNANANVILQNGLIYNVSHTNRDAVGIRSGNNQEPSSISNVTITDIRCSASSASYGAYGVEVSADSDRMTHSNLLITNITNTGPGPAQAYSNPTPTGITAQTIGTDDATSPTVGLRNLSISFEDAPARDYRLAASDTDAIDVGTDLGAGPVAIDLLGRDRNAEGDIWDLGGFEFVGSAEIIDGNGLLTTDTADVSGSGTVTPTPKRIEFTAANGTELRDENGNVIASESMTWEWYGKTTDTTGDPDDSGADTITAGEVTLTLLSGPALGSDGTMIIRVDSDPLWHGIFRMTVT